VYHELRRIAHAHLRGERPGHTLNTTALVHEAYLKLVGVERVEWQDRAHFYAAAAGAMRRILIDYARTRKRVKRGGENAVQVPLVEALDLAVERSEDLLALDEALTRLETQNQRQGRVVECRCFAGLSVDETAAALGISPATVKRDWDFSRAWLNRELGPSAGNPAALNSRP
jgi:RNA polymerase sigma-70 factor, ECF subfamily